MMLERPVIGLSSLYLDVAVHNGDFCTDRLPVRRPLAFFESAAVDISLLAKGAWIGNMALLKASGAAGLEAKPQARGFHHARRNIGAKAFVEHLGQLNAR